MADPFAGAAAGVNPLAWAGFGIALVVVAGAGGPQVAGFIRLSLIAVMLYVFLANADALAPALDRLNRALSFRPSPTPGAAGGTRKLVS